MSFLFFWLLLLTLISYTVKFCVACEKNFLFADDDEEDEEEEDEKK